MAFLGNYTCNSFQQGILSGQFDFGPTTSDVYKIALYTNAATLNASTASYSPIGEVFTTGYTAGGNVISPILGIADGISYVNFGGATWNAAITARGALIYKYDGVTNPAICVLDFGSDKTSTNVFTVQFPPSTSSSALIRLI